MISVKDTTIRNRKRKAGCNEFNVLSLEYKSDRDPGDSDLEGFRGHCKSSLRNG